MGKKVLIVGGVAGGASAAARLRRLDEWAEIILFERGEHISFANCGLPYYIGEEITEKSALTLQTPRSFHARFAVDVRVRHEVLSIDRKRKTVTVENLESGTRYEESYDTLILSPGAAAQVPDVEGIGSPRVFTLRNIPDTYRIEDFIAREKPKTAFVLGGGYIGLEMAESLGNAGLAVSVMVRSNQLMAPLDYDMACDLHHHLREKGVRLYFRNALKKVEAGDGGLRLTLADGTVSADMLILAVGVRPESELAKEAGLAVNSRGGIIVNDRMQSSDESIYAVGDAVEVGDFVTGQRAEIPLAGPANKQGRIAADNICGIPSTYGGTQRSAILRAFDMTVATTGINEKTAKALGLAYEKSFTHSPSHASYYPGARNLSIKLLFAPDTGKILGCQIVGFEGADKRCDVVAVAIRAGMTVYDLAELELCYAPPYSSAKDPVNMAGFVAENLLRGKVKNFHWHDVPALQGRDDVTLLDTRTEMEYRHGYIEGAANIPLDSLRARMDELPKEKPVYIVCQIGLRGYIAARILSQHGYEAYNLSGGYRLYQSIRENETPLEPAR